MTHSPLEPLLSPEGWAHASAEPVDATDPGRFHALFGRDSLILALQVLPAVRRSPRRRSGHSRRDRGRSRTRRPRSSPAGSCTRTDRSPPTGSCSAAGRSATGRCATSAPRTPRRGSWSCWTPRGTRASPTSSPTPTCGGRLAGAGVARRWRAGAVRPADLPRWTRAAGLARRPRPVRGRGRGRDRAAGRLDADGAARRCRLAGSRGRRPGRARPARPGLREQVVGPRGPATGPDRGGLPPRRDGAGGGRPTGARCGLAARLAALGGRPVRPGEPGRCRPVDPARPAHGVRRTDAGRHPPGLPPRGLPSRCRVALRLVAVLGRAPRGGVRRRGAARPGRCAGRGRDPRQPPELYAVTAQGELREIAIANRVQAWTVGAVLAFDDDWDGRVR